MSHTRSMPPIFDLPTVIDDAELVLVPVPFDATASYQRGAMDGPETIRRESVQVDLYDPLLGAELRPVVTMRDESEDVRSWCADARRLVDGVRKHRGEPDKRDSVAQVNDLGSRVNRWAYEACRTELDRGRAVSLIGGDHSTAFGCIQAHLERYPRMGLLHIDAHADLRLAYEGFVWSHASILRNVLDKTQLARLVQVGIRDYCLEERSVIEQSAGRVVTFFDGDLAHERLGGTSFATQVSDIVAALPDEVYISFDIDGLDPSLCPSTGTPVPGGLTFHQATYLIEAVVKAKHRVVGFDLTEVAPGADGRWDGNVGARVLMKLCAAVLRACEPFGR